MIDELQGRCNKGIVPECHSSGISDLVQSFHVTCKGNMIQRGKATPPRSHSSTMVQPELEKDYPISFLGLFLSTSDSGRPNAFEQLCR